MSLSQHVTSGDVKEWLNGYIGVEYNKTHKF